MEGICSTDYALRVKIFHYMLNPEHLRKVFGNMEIKNGIITYDSANEEGKWCKTTKRLKYKRV